jgi:hypothetical protein
MKMHDLIFSRVWPQMLYRHVGFWVGQVLFWLYWAVGFAGAFSTTYIGEKLQYNLFFIPHILYTYFIVYFLAPRFFNTKKYKAFAVWVAVTTLICFVLAIGTFYQHTNMGQAPTEKQLLNIWYSSTSFIFNGPPAICAMFVTFKILKQYFIKTREYRLLTKENANAELQLLNAEIQPHFLFNTLNTIYSFTLDKSLETGSLILKLKDTIGYMVHECDSEKTALGKEIKMIKDYIGLEKMRYGKRLSVDLDIEGEYKGKMIAPLLMIPFVENCFKHGVGKTIGHSWIDCRIKIKDDQLYFSISNSNGHESPPNEKSGIGLANVKKRLELLYPGQYKLLIEHSNHAHSVQMQVPVYSIQQDKLFIKQQRA